MKWAVLLSSVDISGGIYVVFEHAIRAMRRGSEVYIVTEAPVLSSSLDWHPEAKELNFVTFEEASVIDFDVAIATWWRTVYELYRVKAKTYAYFVQSIESRFYKEDELLMRKLVDATYMLPLKAITEANWIKQYIKEHYNQQAKLVLNGIRKDIYSQPGEVYAKRESGKLRILVEGPLGVPFKNVERTIELCRQSDADEVWLLTSSPTLNYPGVDKVFSQIPIFETPLVYRSCDVLVKLSYVEGMFGPPLEMFHCGGTAITYNVTGHDEYISHNYNALVAERDNEEQVVSFINELKNSPDFLLKLKKGAEETASQWPDWDKTSLEFERVVSEIVASEPIPRDIIERQSKFFLEFYELVERSKLSESWINSARFVISKHFPIIYKQLRTFKWWIKPRLAKIRYLSNR